MDHTYAKLIIASVLAGALLVGCAETELAIHTTKRIQHATTPKADQIGTYKVGKPYQIEGVWYYPASDYDYKETGIASWYGTKFHGRRTANGETFDMNGLTAAHRTLPLPSLTRVTNLENGRSIIVRINDRGPFARGRIIDLSRRSARILGFKDQGTAKVRVEILPEESLKAAVLAQRNTPGEKVAALPAVPREGVESVALPGSVAPRTTAKAPRSRWWTTRSSEPLLAANWGEERTPNGLVTKEAVGRSKIFVQAGSFVNFENAARLRARLSMIASAKVKPMQMGKQKYYRVRLGPLLNVKDADYVLEKVVSRGHQGAKIVVE